ncbi:phage tail protein [Pseudomonas monteilii]|uniref:Phage tail protein n=1 Tax=Pseudomonas monteilii TaxID=76759 RepID=A0A7X3F1E9_9PSED|nr:phage tail protein [Pseudomonas monteilii]MVF49531.1 phage tail protein [Pseudomonas monteilii]
MSLISSSIPNFVNGVSQQPFTLRLASQLDAQENGISTVSEGLMKRPPTTHLARVTASPLESAFVHTINRDASERYQVAITNGGLRVFAVDGSERTVSFPDGTSYLAASDPASDFTAITVADYTFIVNKAITVANRAAVSATRGPEALISVIQGNYGRTYGVILNGVTVATYATPDGSDATKTSLASTDYIATELVAGIQSAGFTCVRAGSCLYITSTADFTIDCYDGFNNNAMKAYKKVVQSFSTLPSNCTQAGGCLFEITGDPGDSSDDYYVYYDVGTDSTGVWRECVGPGVALGLDGSTMPHTLVRNADGTFTFQAATWTDRVAGDADTNEDPSFVGRTINDVVFYRNRLGFLADEAVIFSESGKYWNFYRTTVTELLDSDPIDVSSTYTKVAILKHAVSFNKQLLLFSDEVQFLIDNGDTLTPKTISIKPSTEFVCNALTTPQSVGKNVYFASDRENWTAIREYFTDTNDVSNDSTDVASHVPQYIPSGVFKIASSSSEDMLCVLTTGDRHSIYVYKFYWDGDTKVQSSWSKWTFPDTDTILSAEFLDSEVFLAINRADGLYFEKLTVATDSLGTNEPYLVHLDRKQYVTKDTLSYADGYTTIPHSWAMDDGTYMAVTATGQTLKPGVVAEIVWDGATAKVKGNYTSSDLIVGRRYVFSFQLSTITVKTQSAGGGTKSDTEGRLQLRKASVNFANTGYFQVKVTPRYRDTYTYTYSGKVLGTPSATLGQAELSTGKFTFPIMTQNTDATIVIQNDSPMPSAFLSADWEGFFVKRSQAV